MGGVSTSVLTDRQWARVQPLLRSSVGRRGRPFRDDRRVVEGIIYRYRCGIAWRDVPAEFGLWQTIWKRHRRYSGDGTWDGFLSAQLTAADAQGEVDWSVSVDSTVNRAHQHGANLPRTTGGPLELHESAEPDDHAIGRSRGGLSTKIHALVDGKGRPLALLVAPGQGGDAPMFTQLIDQLKIARI
jgi:transposase